MDLAAKLAAKLTAKLAKIAFQRPQIFTAKLAAKLATRVNIPCVKLNAAHDTRLHTIQPLHAIHVQQYLLSPLAHNLNRTQP